MSASSGGDKGDQVPGEIKPWYVTHTYIAWAETADEALDQPVPRGGAFTVEPWVDTAQYGGPSS